MFKKIIILLIIFVMCTGCTSGSSEPKAEETSTETTSISESKESSAETEKHTMTIEFTDPVSENDEYSWLITSEAGHLAECIALLGQSGHPDSELFGDDTSVIFQQDAIDINEIIKKFNLDIVSTNISEYMPITIYYTRDDVEKAVAEYYASESTAN